MTKNSSARASPIINAVSSRAMVRSGAVSVDGTVLRIPSIASRTTSDR
ncbi:MAG: hypothetical protein R3F29_11100 [Planctomycetota bacterium]